MPSSVIAQQTQVVTHGLSWADWALAGAIVLVGIGLGQAAKRLVIEGPPPGRLRARRRPGGRSDGELDSGRRRVRLRAVGDRRTPRAARGGAGHRRAGAGVRWPDHPGHFPGSITLQIRRPFRAGDQVSVGGCEGTVEDVDFRTVVLRSFDGDRILVPCAAVLLAPIVNHTTLGRRRTSLAIGVAYDTDLGAARQVLVDAVASVGDASSLRAPEVWVERFDDSSIALVVRFWHQPDIATEWRVRSEVAVAAKGALDAAGIELAFPQRVVRLLADPDPGAR